MYSYILSWWLSMIACLYQRKFHVGSESAELISELQEQCRVQFSEENFGHAKTTQKQFSWESLHLMKHRSITCILKQNSSPCNENTMAHPLKKFWMQPSAGKIMSSSFWDLEKNFLVDCISMVLYLGTSKRSSRKINKGRWHGVSCFFTTLLTYTIHRQQMVP